MSIENLLSQVTESIHSRWHWITALNYEELGYSDNMIGCIEIISINQDLSEKRIILSHDDDFDDFFACFGLLSLDKSGVLK